MKVSKIIAKLHKWPHTFLPIYHLQFLNLLKLSLFLGCTLISVMASSISSVEDRNTPEYLKFFGQPVSKRRVDLLLLGKNGFVARTQTGCAMHRLSVWCSLKAVELLFRHGAPPQWSVCMPGEDTSKEQVATARIFCASYCRPPSSSGATWEHTGTEPKNCSGKRNSLCPGTLSSSAPRVWYLPIFFWLENHHVHSRMTGKEKVPSFVPITC